MTENQMARFKDIDIVAMRRDLGVPSYEERYRGVLGFVEIIAHKANGAAVFSKADQIKILQAIATLSREYLGMMQKAKEAGLDGPQKPPSLLKQ